MPFYIAVSLFFFVPQDISFSCELISCAVIDIQFNRQRLNMIKIYLVPIFATVYA